MGLSHLTKSAQSCKGPPSQDPSCSWLLWSPQNGRSLIGWKALSTYYMRHQPLHLWRHPFWARMSKKMGLDKRHVADEEKHVILFKNVSVSCMMILQMSIWFCINFWPTFRVHFEELMMSPTFSGHVGGSGGDSLCCTVGSAKVLPALGSAQWLFQRLWKLIFLGIMLTLQQ